jgi:secretion/DNA translocation related TadE-like protein
MRRERGSASVLLVGLLPIMLIIAVAVIEAAGLVGSRIQAQTAADAAALAAAAATFPAKGEDPQSQAVRFAEANGTELVSCRCPMNPSFEPRVVTVIVTMAHHTRFFGEVVLRAGASAEFHPEPALDS